MLAKPVKEVPDLGHTEPKWDGFRTIVFRDGDEVVLGSRNEKPLTRYFPELVEALKGSIPNRCVLDGEIIIIGEERLDFDSLQHRIHPAASRIALLAEQTPASFVGFDMLAEGDSNLMGHPFEERRQRLAAALADAGGQVLLTPATADLGTAQRWFSEFEGAGLDGVIAKPLGGIYEPDKRTMFKVKHERTADCVVAGYRLHKSSTAAAPLLGSLLLGLYDEGQLQHVGVAASFTAARRAELIDELRPLEVGPADVDDHPWAAWEDRAIANPDRVPGTVSRWSQGKDLSFVPLRPELVVEVAYDSMQGSRFRHTARFRRWRPDRDPASCTYDQLDRPVDFRLTDIFNAGGG